MNQPTYESLPYEKFMRKGAEALTDAELLAIMLRTGPKPEEGAEDKYKRCPALLLAEKILALPKGGKSGLSGLSALSYRQLQQIKGVGEVKAVRICCISELARRIALAARTDLPAFPNPMEAAEYCRPLFAEEGGCVEKVILLLLDGAGRLIFEKVLSVGTVNTALVSPREIFLQALKYQAVTFLLLHNHPSGDASPSREDAELTKRLAELGELMELAMTDHIIVGQNSYFSFREAGLL